jgi:hypothetical protein
MKSRGGLRGDCDITGFSTSSARARWDVAKMYKETYTSARWKGRLQKMIGFQLNTAKQQ